MRPKITFRTVCGGDEGDRTPDLLTASQARSQLRYTPKIDYFGIIIFLGLACQDLTTQQSTKSCNGSIEKVKSIP